MELPILFKTINWEAEGTLVSILRHILFAALKDAFGEDVKDVRLEDIHLEHPQEKKYGDYSTNVALVWGSRLKKNPVELSKQMVTQLSKYITTYHNISLTSKRQEEQGVKNLRNGSDRSSKIADIHPGHKQLGQSSDEVIGLSLKGQKIVVSDILEGVTVAGPGFINLTIRKEYVSTLIHQLLDMSDEATIGQEYLQATGGPLLGKKIMVEFAHPNTHKEFHIGHLRNISIGESLVRVLKANGATTFRANFEGDVGLHVAKAIWGVKRLMQKSKIKDQSEKGIGNTINATVVSSRIDDGSAGNSIPHTLDDLRGLIPASKAKFLGQGYSLGCKMYDEDETAKREIIELNKAIYTDALQVELWQETRQWSLEYFDSIYKRLNGTDFQFDRFFFESEVEKVGRNLVKDNIINGIFVKDEDGSIYFPGEKVGLNNCVFVTKEDYATYEGKDIALEDLEYRTFPFDVDIHVVASEQQNFFQIAFAAVEQLFPVQKGRQFHLSYGMVNLKGSKLSSRTGDIVTADVLIDEAKTRILEIMNRSNTSSVILSEAKNLGQQAAPDASLDPSASPQDDVAEKVAVAAVKYSMLKVNPRMEIAFDIEESVSLEGDSGPYLLYTYARCKSVLRKSKENRITYNVSRITYKKDNKIPNTKYVIPNTEENALLRTLYRFPEVVVDCARNLSPNLLCTYLFDLAQAFNLFYNKHTILGVAQNESQKSKVKSQNHNLKVKSSEKDIIFTNYELPTLSTNFRLFLTDATSRILKQGLYLLGIQTVERM